MTPKFAIVIGASSGIGIEMVRQLAQSGCRVAAVARREDRLIALSAEFPNQVLPFAHDVTHYAEVPELFQRIAHELGGLDLVIYNSGIMPEVAPGEYNFEKDFAMVEVNLLGAIAWLNQAADRFQHTRRGTIVGIGSVAGDRGRASLVVYGTTKSALCTYLEALRNRLCKLGVTVVTIKPGPIKTDMTKHLQMNSMMEPTDAAQKILRLASRTGEHYLKPTHWLIFAIIKRVPSAIFRRLNL